MTTAFLLSTVTLCDITALFDSRTSACKTCSAPDAPRMRLSELHWYPARTIRLANCRADPADVSIPGGLTNFGLDYFREVTAKSHSTRGGLYSTPFRDYTFARFCIYDTLRLSGGNRGRNHLYITHTHTHSRKFYTTWSSGSYDRISNRNLSHVLFPHEFIFMSLFVSFFISPLHVFGMLHLNPIRGMEWLND